MKTAKEKYFKDQYKSIVDDYKKMHLTHLYRIF